MPHQTFGRHKDTIVKELTTNIDKIEFDSVNDQAFVVDNSEKAIYSVNLRIARQTKLVSTFIYNVSDLAYGKYFLIC
jgi:hypothetical protein